MTTDVQHYLNHISTYEREFKKWEGRVEKIIDRYKDKEGSTRKSVRFNVLWSNVQTLKAATYARMPQPDVSRRFKDQDPVGRVAGMLLERALEFEVNHYDDFGATLRECVYDRFLGGRATAWVRYDPTFKQVQSGQEADDGFQPTEDAEAESEAAEELDFECAPVDYVHWKDFGHSVARTWEEVEVVWRKVYLTRPKLVEMFGDEGNKIPLDSNPDEKTSVRGSADTDAVNKMGLIYEIWDKATGKCLFLSRSLGKIIKEMDDPLELEQFFPCPRPLYATLTTDSLVPIPDPALYQDQANSLNVLADRIDGLIKQLQVKGVYNAEFTELARLFTEAENGTLVPVKNWMALAEKQGLKGSIDLIEIAPIAQALNEAYQAFEAIKNQIYELTGISDIIRGDTAASETATAQQIKNSYASMRLKVYQDEVERFATRLLQMKAQIICKHFDAETILQIGAADQLSMADRQFVIPAVQLLKDDTVRSFRISVATDSMVYQNEQQEKQDRMEFLNAVGGFLQQLVGASQTAPQVMALGVEMLKFGVTGFRIGKSLEGTIDQYVDQFKQQASQPQADPNAAQAQSDVQKTHIQEQSAQQQKAMEIQADQQKHAAELAQERALEQYRAQADAAIANAQAQANERLEAMKQQHEAQMAAMQQQHDHALAGVNNSLQMILQQLKNQSAIEVAELSSQTTLDAAQISAAKSAE